VDVVFGVYRDILIKSAERELRGESDAITFKNLAAGQVKQFKNFLRNSDKITKSCQICCGTLEKTPSRKRLEDKELHVTCGNRSLPKEEEEEEEEEEECFPARIYVIYSYIHSGEAESHQLPPCQDSLYKHCRRANYQKHLSILEHKAPSLIFHFNIHLE